MLGLGYSAVQMGTRFIATEECTAHADYKKAILRRRGEGHRPDRADHGRPALHHPDAVRREDGDEGGPDRTVDALGAPDEALDAGDLLGPVGLPAEERLDEGGFLEGLLAGGEERRDDPLRRDRRERSSGASRAAIG